jgi:hypothetical protein
MRAVSGFHRSLAARGGPWRREAGPPMLRDFTASLTASPRAMRGMNRRGHAQRGSATVQGAQKDVPAGQGPRRSA